MLSRVSSVGNENWDKLECCRGDGLRVSASQDGVGDAWESGYREVAPELGMVLVTVGLPLSRESSSKSDRYGD